jgi:hypothetical protein
MRDITCRMVRVCAFHTHRSISFGTILGSVVGWFDIFQYLPTFYYTDPSAPIWGEREKVKGSPGTGEEK